MNIQMPIHLIPEALSDLERDLAQSVSAPEANLDFSTLSYSYPLGMLVAGSMVRRWAIDRKNRGLRTTKSGISGNCNAHSYLMHLGFFDFVGMSGVGSEVGVARGNTRYVPIRIIERSELEPGITESNETLVDRIRFTADGIANVLAGAGASTEGRTTFSYSVREVLRNTFEHAETDRCVVCGQRWANGQAEIAFVDEGVGVMASLNTAHSFEENDVLHQAIKPGVSRAQYLDEAENTHDNSGFGLYVLSELGNSFGWFCLGSGTRKLMVQGHSKTQENMRFPGTYVGLHLNSTPRNFSGVLNDIIEAGEAEAQQEGREKSASKLSKMA